MTVQSLLAPCALRGLDLQCLSTPCFLFWYAKQSSNYANPANWPGLPWFNAVPTTWDESRTLAGSIGQFVAVARRRGDHLVPGSDDQRDGPDAVAPAVVHGQRCQLHRHRLHGRHAGQQAVADAGRGQHPDRHLGHAERGHGSRGRPGDHPQAELTGRPLTASASSRPLPGPGFSAPDRQSLGSAYASSHTKALRPLIDLPAIRGFISCWDHRTDHFFCREKPGDGDVQPLQLRVRGCGKRTGNSSGSPGRQATPWAAAAAGRLAADRTRALQSLSSTASSSLG